MKFFKFMTMILLAITFSFTACDDDGGSGGGDVIVIVWGETYTADGLSFHMTSVLGGNTFPTGVNDNGTATVDNAYMIGETEVTYELWQKVYTWATTGSGATGAGQYTFANVGTRGGYYNSGYFVYDSGHETHPVTTVNWRDCMVWCNALTEWYNSKKGTNYACVYKVTGIPIRDSRDNDTGHLTSADICDDVAPDLSADGFRLLSSNEFELASRYRTDTLWTYGDHVSGDNSGACYNDGSMLGGMGLSTILGNYTVYYRNSNDSTAAVKSKTHNALGLCDMSGNVWEWCFDASGDGRVARGGSWLNDFIELRLGYWVSFYPYYEDCSIGFRFARTQ